MEFRNGLIRELLLAAQKFMSFRPSKLSLDLLTLL